MIESVLAKHSAKVSTKITVKSLISVGIVALAVLLPQLVHLVAGASGGVQWLPMYLPVLLGGCLLGWKWGLGVGVLSPLVSFAITSLAGNAMPAAGRLPYMMAELAAFAAVSGLFSKRIAANGWMAFPAVLLAQVSGRAVFSRSPPSSRASPLCPRRRCGRRFRRGFWAWSCRRCSCPLS